MTSSPRLIQIAGLMALADHDYVQISKSTGLSYQEAERIWREVQTNKDGAKQAASKDSCKV